MIEKRLTPEDCSAGSFGGRAVFCPYSEQTEDSVTERRFREKRNAGFGKNVTQVFGKNVTQISEKSIDNGQSIWYVI